MKNENCDRKSTCDDYKYNHCDGCGANKPIGDLISRSELLGKFTAMLVFSSDRVILIENVIEQIQNAPTVPLPDFKEGYKQAIIDGRTNFSRPQGDWNYIQADMCVCPFCGAMPHKLYKNYCAKCGAELKGGAEC